MRSPCSGVSIFSGKGQSRTNNRRLKASFKSYLHWRDNLIFDAVKYRRLLRIISRHLHLALSPELQTFIHDRHWKKKSFTTPLLENFRQAHYSAKALENLPFSVAEGLATRFNISRADLIQRVQGQLSEHEKLRLQTAAGKKGLRLNPEKVSLSRLLSYLFSLPHSERQARLSEFEELIQRCRQRFQLSWLTLPRLALIIDNSQSSRGSRESWLRPLITALSAHYVLEAQSIDYRVFWTHPPQHPLLAEAKGQTNLATPLLEALEWGAQEIVMISDGAENDPAGGVDWLLKQVKQVAWTQLPPGLLHCNPTLSPEHYGTSPLSSELPMLGLHEGESLPLLWLLSRFARQSMPLDELTLYLRRAADVALANPSTR